MNSIQKRPATWMIIVACVFTLSCKKLDDNLEGSESLDDSISYAVESALGDLQSQTTTLVTAGFDSPVHTESVKTRAACSYASARGTCASTSRTVNWGDCTLSTGSGLTFTVKGTITENYSGFGAAVCLMTGDGSSLTRRVSSDNPRVITSSLGGTLTSTMTPDTAWDGTTFSSASTGTVITRLQTGSSNGLTCGNLDTTACYHVVVNGVQNVRRGPRGRKMFDHIITSDLTVQGRRTDEDMTVTGTSSVWHQLLKYKAVNTFNNVVYGDEDCCFPTSGSISTVFTGSVSGSGSMSFSATCGQAQFTDTTGETKTVTLTQCHL